MNELKHCLICNKLTKLVKHHWWENTECSIGHIRLICSKCNVILRTPRGLVNHIMPEWDEQIKYAKKYINNENLITFSIRLRSINKQKILDLKHLNQDKAWDDILNYCLDYADYGKSNIKLNFT